MFTLYGVCNLRCYSYQEWYIRFVQISIKATNIWDITHWTIAINVICREETDDISKSNMSNYELSNTHKYSSFAIRMKKNNKKNPTIIWKCFAHRTMQLHIDNSLLISLHETNYVHFRFNVWRIDILEVVKRVVLHTLRYEFMT